MHTVLAGTASRVVSAIRSVVGHGPVALREPYFAGNEWAYVKECLDSTFVSSVGKFVDRFEADLAAFTGARHAVALVNGTAALHVALQLAGVEPRDEVLAPALTFMARSTPSRIAARRRIWWTTTSGRSASTRAACGNTCGAPWRYAVGAR